MDSIDFVPYEESLELKELGFNEPCVGFYLDTKKFYLCSHFEGNTITSDNYDYYETSNNTVKCFAPLYQHAFRWFRKKGYDVSINRFTKTLYQFIIESKDNEDHYYYSDYGYVNFEAAQIHCLRKLIQILKNLNK
jgi:hypothetical protein